MLAILPTKAETIAVLEHAAVILDAPGHWTTGVFARDSCGNAVTVDSDQALQFCFRGAVSRALKELGFTIWGPGRRFEESISLEIGRYVLAGPEPCREAGVIGDWNNVNDYETVRDGLATTIHALKVA